MPETQPRFDVIYRGDSVSIDYHFCRELAAPQS